MSQQLISRSPDLKKLRDEGYELSIVESYVVMQHVPYVNSGKQVKFGTLVSELTLAGDIAGKPGAHTVFFQGEHPCDVNGSPLNIVAEQVNRVLSGELVVQYNFSRKPLDNGQKRDYRDYYEKMTTYASILSGPATTISPGVTAKTYAPVEDNDEASVFNYVDTASSRAEIVEATKKLQLHKVAIIGLGGTGSYILDFVAKTPVGKIHIFDSDTYFTHNAFRSPGAPSLEDLRQQPKKVDHFKSIYSNMHKGIVSHDYDIDGSNIDELKDMDFVFISIHGGNNKRVIFDKLEEFGIPFIDVGMGLYLVKNTNSIGGQLRVTTSTVYNRDPAKKNVSFSDSEMNNEYATNIQVADLNAYNAILAIIKWKKLFGFYLDLEKEHSSVYTIDGNIINNSDKP